MSESTPHIYAPAAEAAATDKPVAAEAPAARPRGLKGTLVKWFKPGPLRRVFRNAGVLLSGKTVAGLASLAALALTARGLGPELFGVLVLIQTYVLLIAGLAKFQSSQAVIHYGAKCLEDGRRGDFQGLIKFTLLLDLGSAVIGTAMAVAAAPLVAQWLGWSAEAVPLAMLYSLLILFTVTATPIGILRLFDRFDLLAVQETLKPTLRLLGVAAAYLADAPFWVYVVAWIASGMAGRLALLVLGWREFARQGLMRDMTLSLRRLVKPHPGLWRFAWMTNLNTSVSEAGSRMGVLIIGWMLGPAGAALYKVADQFARVLVKVVGQLGHTIYPELARLSAQGSAKMFRKTVLRAGAVAGTGGVLALAALAALGKPLIALTVGPDYVEAYGLMLLLALATTIAIFAFPLSPALYAMGRPDIVFRVKLTVTALFSIPVLVLLLWQVGLLGAGIAAVLGSTVGATTMTVIALRRLTSAQAQDPSAANTNRR